MASSPTQSPGTLPGPGLGLSFPSSRIQDPLVPRKLRYLMESGPQRILSWLGAGLFPISSHRAGSDSRWRCSESFTNNWFLLRKCKFSWRLKPSPVRWSEDSGSGVPTVNGCPKLMTVITSYTCSQLDSAAVILIEQPSDTNQQDYATFTLHTQIETFSSIVTDL